MTTATSNSSELQVNRPTQARQDTREALLDAAEALFVEHGYAAVGIREIVERAGANIAAIKYHFGSKSNLYLATVCRAVQRNGCGDSWAVLRDAAEGGVDGTAAALYTFVDQFLEKLVSPTEASAVCGLIAREAAEPTEAIDVIVSGFVKPHQSLIVSALRNVAPGRPEAELLLTAETLVAQLLHFRNFRPLIERSGVVDLSQPEEVTRVAQHIVRSVLRQLQVDEKVISRAIESSKG